MSKVTLALGSFIVGACCMFLALSGNHASTFAQGKISAPGSVSAIDIPGAIPVVPNLTMGFTDEEIGGLMQQIDGLICTRCTFTSPVCQRKVEMSGFSQDRNVRFHDLLQG
jgi:hypothetical protein